MKILQYLQMFYLWDYRMQQIKQIMTHHEHFSLTSAPRALFQNSFHSRNASRGLLLEWLHWGGKDLEMNTLPIPDKLLIDK